tara:strand:- start:3772 stop:4179 length:408 start_codon:yes stop_codon:yes gene_type:complete
MSITITEIRNAVSINDDDTEFELEINHPEHGWIQYLLNSIDTDTTINNSALITLIGSNFTKITQSEKDTRESLWQRTIRNERLIEEVDPIVTNPLRWAELSSDKQTAWTKYRTDLLNVPQQSGFPWTHTFPTKPS